MKVCTSSIFVTISNTDNTEQKFRQKCNELKKRIAEVEESNEIATIALARTRMSIRRLRLEHSVLLERLEEQILRTPGSDELMSHPPRPALLDDSLNIKAVKNATQKSKKNKAILELNGSTKKAVRDPDLPRPPPTNAFSLFCEKEKEKASAESLTNNDEKGNNDVLQHLTDSWNLMNEEQKKPYQLLFEEERQRYEREMLEYDTRRQDSDLKQLVQNPNASSSVEADSSSVSEPLENDKIKRQKMNPPSESITLGSIDGASQGTPSITGV